MAKKIFGGSATSYTKQISEYCANLKFEDIPENVLERAKMLTLHTIGVALAAGTLPQAQAAVNSARVLTGKGTGSATVWTTGEKMSPSGACFANGTISDILDWEDCAWTGHPTACVIPVSAAMAEDKHKCGKDYLTAVVTGYEAYIRIAMSAMPPDDWDHSKGWGIVSFQNMAATVPAAKLLNFDKEQFEKAIGISVINTPIGSVLTQATMSNAYHYQNGLNCINGILACSNVEEGFDNLDDSLDVPYAYHELLTVEPKREWITRRLDEFYMMQILVKHWPANMWIQTPIEIVYDMAQTHNINPDNILEIIVDPPTQYRMHFYEEGFSSLMDAQFSMPFVIASMLYGDKPGANWYERKLFTDPKIIALASKIKGGDSPEQTLNDCFTMFQHGEFPEKTVTITMNDGTTYKETGSKHKGHPDNMLSRDEFCKLFMDNAIMVLSETKAADLMNFILNIENVDDMAMIGSFFDKRN